MSFPTLGRRLGLLAVLIAVISFTAPLSIFNPPSAQAAQSASTDIPIIGLIPGVPDPCDLIGNGTARAICKAGTDPIGGALGGVNAAIGAIPGIPSPSELVGSAVSTVGKAVVGPILNGIAQAEGDVVLKYLKKQTEIVNSSTTPDLTAPWFLQQYELVFALAIAVGLGALFFRTGKGFINKDLAEAGKGGMAFMVFFVLGGFLPGIVASVIKVTDDVMAPAWMNSAGAGANTALDNLQTNLNNSLAGTIAAVLAPLIILFIGVIAGIIFELMFLFRDAVIYIVTALEVVAVALSVAGRVTSTTAWRCTWALVALILFKLNAAIILTFGLLLLQSTEGSGDTFLLAAVVLILAPAMTWGIYKVISGHNVSAPHTVIINSRAANYLGGKFRR